MIRPLNFTQSTAGGALAGRSQVPESG